MTAGSGRAPRERGRATALGCRWALLAVLLVFWAGLHGCSSDERVVDPPASNGPNTRNAACLACHADESVLRDLIPEDPEDPDEPEGDG